MINAPSTASGRFLNSGVNAMTVMTLSTVATSGDISLCAPAPSFTAVCDRLPPLARPPSNPEPMLETPSAIISWSGSMRYWCLSANVCPAPSASEKITSIMPSALGISTHSSLSCKCGTLAVGSPVGILPTVSTP